MVSNEKIKLLDRTGRSVEQEQNLWPALVITKEEIDTELERLADLPIPENGRRQSLFVHPRATAPGSRAGRPERRARRRGGTRCMARTAGRERRP